MRSKIFPVRFQVCSHFFFFFFLNPIYGHMEGEPYARPYMQVCAELM